jgi:CBS domain-containing protein
MIPLTVGEVMTSPVETVTEGLTATEAARRMREFGVGGLPVLDGGRVRGLVTESDVLEVVAAGLNPAETHLGVCMSTPVVTATPEENIMDVAARMREHSVRRVPVLDGDELVGIVTTTDLAHYLPRLRATILRERTAVRLPPPG